MRDRILMVAFHYPPIQASSGVHRTLSFSDFLARHGWLPTVLTVSYGALPGYRLENETMIPPGVEVIRAPTFDLQQHLNIKGKYPGFLAVPDRWASWIASGITLGLLHIARRRPRVLYSTYPIASAHIIGYWLHRLTGVPWIADLRDPMAQDGYPPEPRVWRAYKAIEERLMARASRVIFAAPSAYSYYAQIYPQAVAARGIVIENGYDEALFRQAESLVQARTRQPLRLVHAGVLYPAERDPRSFFQALCQLRDAGELAAGEVEIVLRGSGHDELYAPMLAAAGLCGIVHLEPPVGYREALVEMLEADGLLLFQSADCNFQIPAKIYEYFRARRPIIAFTDPAGDTGQVLQSAHVPWIAPLDDPNAITAVLRDALAAIRARRDEPYGSAAFAAACSREGRAEIFFDLVQQVARGTPHH